MKLNKKYFLAIFIALGIQVVLGINFANAMQCEKEIEYQYYNQTPQEKGFTHPNDGEPDGTRRWFNTLEGPSYAIGRLPLDKIKAEFYNDIVRIISRDSRQPDKFYWDTSTHGKAKTCRDYFRDFVLNTEYKNQQDGVKCIAEYMIVKT